MGVLVVRRIPAMAALGLADHTYVECDTGARGWGCFGRKQGGTELRRAPGSTLRAAAIAGVDEHAGLSCYLINGVCHQAANRILSPAGITVDGARGYGLSNTLFGHFGRVRFDPCFAPFNEQHAVRGDHADCLHPDARSQVPRNTVQMTRHDWVYMSRVIRTYLRAALSGNSPLADFDMQMSLFSAHAEHRIPDVASFRPLQFSYLLSERLLLEQRRVAAEVRYANHRSIELFAKEFDELTVGFQETVSNLLNDEEFEALLDVPRNRRIVVSDPEIIRQIAGSRSDDPGATH